MAWDFSTDPEFELKLQWMRQFVREQVWPLETLWDELGWEGLQRAARPLQEQVKEQELWAAHLDPELGGQGYGQVKLGLMHEILGSSPLAPLMFGNAAPDSGNSEILAMAGTPEQKERYLHPLLAGDLKSAFSMTEPDTAGSDPTLLKTRAVRDGDDWVINGHKWYSSNGSIADFMIVMAVTDPDARPAPAGLDVHRRRRHARRQRGARRGDDGASLRQLRPLRQPRRDPLRGRADPRRRAARRRGRRLPDRPAAAVSRPHPPLHALAGRRPPGVRHAVRALAVPRVARQDPQPAPDDPELDRRLRGRDVGGPADDAARRVEDGRRGGRLGAQGDRADQVLRRQGAARRGRPGAPGPWRAGLLDRPAAGGDVPLRPRGADLRRARRGPSRVGRAAGAARLRGARRRRPHRAHPHAPRGRPAASSPTCCRPSRPTTDAPYTHTRERLHPGDDPPRRPARLLRRRRPRGADGRAGARALRRARLRAQGDRPQQARGREAARPRRGVRRVRGRGPGGRDGGVLGPRRLARRARQRRSSAACRRSTPPARW